MGAVEDKLLVRLAQLNTVIENFTGEYLPAHLSEERNNIYFQLNAWGGGTAPLNDYRFAEEKFIPTLNQTLFTILFTPEENSIFVFLNGQHLSNDKYTVSGQDINLIGPYPLEPLQEVVIKYVYLI